MKGTKLRIPLTAELQKTYIHRFGRGNVATDGVVYSPIATFGTTAFEILSELVDPGYSMELQTIEVGLTQHFTELLNAVGSLVYHWKAREEYYDSSQGTIYTRSYVGIQATLSKGIGSLSTSEDTLSGYLSVGSFPHAPVRFVLTALGLVASSMSGKVKNSSYVKLVGCVIPGT